MGAHQTTAAAAWSWSGEAVVDSHSVPFEHMKGVSTNKKKALTQSFVRVRDIKLAAAVNCPEGNALKFLKDVLVNPKAPAQRLQPAKR